jgi:hypothetical protein
MSEDLGWVKFTLAGKDLTAHLGAGGWSVPGGTGIDDLLNDVASPDLFGPADGDPIWCAVEEARQYLDGTETYARPVPEYPEAAIH